MAFTLNPGAAGVTRPRRDGQTQTSLRERHTHAGRNLRRANPESDFDLVERARSNDKLAFEALVVRYERRIYALTFRMTGDAEDAADLTQEAFIRAYRNLPRTSPDLNFPAWLHRIAANACLDALRRRKRVRWQPWDDSQHNRLVASRHDELPERAALAHEVGATIQRVLDSLEPRYRLALILREYQGMSTAEIGEVLHISRSAVKSLVFRAREQFRARYLSETADPPAA